MMDKLASVKPLEAVVFVLAHLSDRKRRFDDVLGLVETEKRYLNVQVVAASSRTAST